MSPFDHTVTFSWSGYEHEHIERGSEWFIAVGVVAICGAIIALFLDNPLFSVLILLAAGTLGLIARNTPDPHTFEVSDDGLRINDTLHRYDEMLSFWIETERDDHPLLLIDTVKLMSPDLIIPIHEVDPQLLRAYLRERMQEKVLHEPFAHKILERLGF